MSLSSKNWTQTSFHNVVLAWLRAEQHLLTQRLASPSPLSSAGLKNLLDAPDINNPDENRARLRLFYMIRAPYFVEIPPDTAWYEVDALTDAELSELHAVRHHDWIDQADRNELCKVAARKRLPLRLQPSNWFPPILWGHDRSGPFTILEGNKRLTAYAGSGQTGLRIPVYVGLSSLACVFHFPDNCQVLMQDLAKWS